VRIALDATDNPTIELRPGMSVIPTIATRSLVAHPVAATASRTSAKISGAS
jgi:membrane fusion protein (multidrug efflux system)